MQFSKIGNHTIRCVISEQEIVELGYTVEEIMSNGERTQEFMNQIFDMAEQQFETKFELGIKTVRADFMSDHTLSLTFSEHPGSEEMMEHLRNIVNGILGSLPQLKQEDDEDDDEGSADIAVVFSDFDVLLRYVRNVSLEKLPPSALWKYEGEYLLMLLLTDLSEEELRKLSNLTDEYAKDIQVGAERKAFIEEHGVCLLKENAMEQLLAL